MITIQDNRMKFNNLPRVKLASLPTPIQPLPNLTKTLNGPKIWIKRDDLTGLAFGGNKARKLEYIMADALNKKADYIVTGAGFHSNWCTQTAAAAKKLGMKIKLIKKGPEEGYDRKAWDGNHLLHKLTGADVKVVKSENFEFSIEAEMNELIEKGHKPYSIPVGGSIPLGAAGYLNAMLEIMYQSVKEGIHFDYLVHATGSGGTHAGLVMGAKALNTNINVIGTTVGWGEKREHIEKVSNIIKESKKSFELDFKYSPKDLIIYTDYQGGGYGFVSEQKLEALKILAQTEGIMIDPVYTATSMACLIDLIKKKELNKNHKVLFLHTGGAVALYPYKEPIQAYLKNKELPWKIPDWSPDR
jgi:D-cysteine desulfhydrase family pyridoxal phosphate-dependent enzyme